MGGTTPRQIKTKTGRQQAPRESSHSLSSAPEASQDLTAKTQASDVAQEMNSSCPPGTPPDKGVCHLALQARTCERAKPPKQNVPVSRCCSIYYPQKGTTTPVTPELPGTALPDVGGAILGTATANQRLQAPPRYRRHPGRSDVCLIESPEQFDAVDTAAFPHLTDTNGGTTP